MRGKLLLDYSATASNLPLLKGYGYKAYSCHFCLSGVTPAVHFTTSHTSQYPATEKGTLPYSDHHKTSVPHWVPRMQVKLRHIKQAPKAIWQSVTAPYEQLELLRLMQRRAGGQTCPNPASGTSSGRHAPALPIASASGGTCPSCGPGSPLKAQQRPFSGTCTQNPVYVHLCSERSTREGLTRVCEGSPCCTRQPSETSTIGASVAGNCVLVEGDLRMQQNTGLVASSTIGGSERSKEGQFLGLTGSKRWKQRDRWRDRWEAQVDGYLQASASM
jgi:hypothetical protein